MALTAHQIAVRDGQVGLSTARVLVNHGLIAIRSVGPEALAALTDAGRAVIA